MKRKFKRKHNLRRTRSAPGPKPRKAQREAVTAWAQAGLVEDQIASRLGVDKNKLRAQHIDDIKQGKAAAAAADAAETVITKEEYYFLNAASSSMLDPDWFDPEHGSLLFPGTNGEGARSVSDAFAYWKNSGGKFITTGLFGKLDPKKYAAFAKVVSEYRQKLQPDDAPLPGRARAGKF